MSQDDQLLSFDNSCHRDQFIASLLSGIGRAPLKFAYSGSGADAHNRAAEGSDYRNLTAAAEAEAAFLGSNLTLRRYSQLCEIGPGNGRHTAMLMHALSKKELVFKQYLGLDFSSAMLRIARNTITSTFDVPITVRTWDVEECATGEITKWRIGSDPLLMLMLGLTIGNFEDPRIALKNIRSSVLPGDILAIGLAITTVSALQSDVVLPYENEKFRQAVLEPFIAIGIPNQCIDLELVIDGFDILAYAILKANFTVNGSRIPAGTRIRCFKSTRFSSRVVHELLEASSWAVIGSGVQEGGPTLVVAKAV